jgi:hypothetical protein
VWAIREGRDAAAAVDKFLMGYTNKVVKLYKNTTPTEFTLAEYLF